MPACRVEPHRREKSRGATWLTTGPSGLAVLEINAYFVKLRGGALLVGGVDIGWCYSCEKFAR